MINQKTEREKEQVLSSQPWNPVITALESCYPHLAEGDREAQGGYISC